MEPMAPIQPKDFKVFKKPVTFISDSYEEHSNGEGNRQLLQGPLKNKLRDFGEEDKNFITEETIELLAPYLELKFDDDVTRDVF
jgi:hypothetical protein